jgi:type IV secretory pathway protease TraF
MRSPAEMHRDRCVPQPQRRRRQDHLGIAYGRSLGRARQARRGRRYPPDPLASFLADRGYLPRGVPLIKRVLALSGQTVCRAGPIITVDGIEMGAARKYDSRRRVLPAWDGCRIVAGGEVFLMNQDEPALLDGRYFGPIPLNAVVGRAVALWTFQED